MHFVRWLGLAVALLGSAAIASDPFPADDGFVYPGQPGSEGVVEFYRRWAAHSDSLPPAEPGRPTALESFAWMVGRWRVVARDYDFEPARGGRIVELGRGTAAVSFSPDARWLRIESTLPGRDNLKYIGWDRAARALVLQEISSPGITYAAPIRSAGWRGDRVAFGPVTMTYYGADYTDRITLVKQGRDAFRIVVESRLASGRFVAMDDLVYTREPDR